MGGPWTGGCGGVKEQRIGSAVQGVKMNLLERDGETLDSGGWVEVEGGWCGVCVCVCASIGVSRPAATVCAGRPPPALLASASPPALAASVQHPIHNGSPTRCARGAAFEPHRGRQPRRDGERPPRAETRPTRRRWSFAVRELRRASSHRLVRASSGDSHARGPTARCGSECRRARTHNRRGGELLGWSLGARQRGAARGVGAILGGNKD